MSIDPAQCAHWLAARRFSPFAEDVYGAWLAAEASHAKTELQLVRASLESMAFRPRISLIVLDTGESEPLSATLSALANQLCQPAEVLVVSGRERAAAVASFLHSSHPACVAIGSPEGGGDGDEASLLAATQLALTRACGEYVAIFRAGDLLEPTAIAVLTITLARWPDAAIVYTDEDWIAADGRRSHPRFKSGWDPEAQLALDLLDGLCLMRRSDVLQLGELRPEFGAAARYHLHCELGCSVASNRIHHIPSVLCHRRIPAGLPSATIQQQANHYSAAARRAAADVASRQAGAVVDVQPSPIDNLVNYVRRSLPTPAPRVSVLVPTRDQVELLKNCLDSLLQGTDYPDLEVLVLDNDSASPEAHALFSALRADPRVRILHTPGPFNFSRINNAGARAATGEILLFLNNDTEILDPNWLQEMVCEVSRPEIGCVGAKLLYGNGTVQHAGVLLQSEGLAMHVCRTEPSTAAGLDARLAGKRHYLAVTGACLAVRRSVFDQLGGFDEANLAVAFNDIDLCLKAGDAGYSNLFTPFATLLHLESVSRGLDSASKQRQVCAWRELAHARAKWGDRFERDPYHNPNLQMDWQAGVRLAPYATRRWQLAR